MLFHNQIKSYITDIPKKEIGYSVKKLKKEKKNIGKLLRHI